MIQEKGLSKIRRIITVRGIVQGVGFRPFIFTLAKKYSLRGMVFNNTSGVHIDVEGCEKNIDGFMRELADNPPPLAKIDDIRSKNVSPAGYTDFKIKISEHKGAGFIPVSPDIAVCEECLREMVDPRDMRYHYPFINCTNCGPRFSIIEDIPYDRDKTSMKAFPMCKRCEGEYKDPGNRRFHAQPVACPECGPEVMFVENMKIKPTSYFKALANIKEPPHPHESLDPKTKKSDRELEKAASLLESGGILAIKGLGGFHLAVNALDDRAVERLRRRKLRYGKPLAVMMKNIEEVKKYCTISSEEEKLLQSPQCPIVILKRGVNFNLSYDKENRKITSVSNLFKENKGKLADNISSGLNTVGVMLPYTPLHHLLMSKLSFPLVMTSGNKSDEPICKENDEALKGLSNIADGFLLHNRPIVNRIDDSVAFFAAGKPRLVRRARGYAPEPIILKKKAKPLIACGSFYKNTFCLARDEYAFLSQHIGDLDNQEAFDYYKEQVEKYKKLFRIEPRYVAHDLHPGYLSTQFAKSLGLPALAVQHHHAHIASAMAECGIEERVLGISYDGTGLGTDGHIWGSEFMIADLKGFKRVGHLKYAPLPGADAAVKNPFRTVLGYICACPEDFKEFTAGLDKKTVEIIMKQIEKGINSPLASSMGRLFDAAAALLGFCGSVSYEGQAAMELEAIMGCHGTHGRSRPIGINAPRPDFDASMADSNSGMDNTFEKNSRGSFIGKGEFYEYDIKKCRGEYIIDPLKVLKALFEEYLRGVEKSLISARFHNTVVRFTVDTAARIRRDHGINRVVLSGGCFQNRYLLDHLNDELTALGFEVYIPSKVPVNDGGIALGQAAIASEYFS